MDEKDIFTMDDPEFEAVLQGSLDDLPPDTIVRDVTPCGESLVRILTGMALNAIKLNFLWLNHLLPSIGILLILVGFRSLRAENKWLRGCWILSVVQTVWHFCVLILNATIYHAALENSVFGYVLTVCSLAVFFGILICFRLGLREVQKKAGLTPDCAGITAMMVWYAIICILAAMKITGILSGILMLIGYICIIRALYETFQELETTGYAIEPAVFRHTNSIVVSRILAAVLAGILCGYLFFHSYPMDWQPADPSVSGDVKEMKDHLLSLGFPEDILEDLTHEDLLECSGALKIVTVVNDHPVNNGRQVSEVEDGHIYIHTVYDEKELRLTGIAVLLPGEREQWKLIHHFRWVIDPGFYGTECIQLWKADMVSEGWQTTGDVSGQVLYTQDNTVYTSPYHSLDKETYTFNSIFQGNQTSTDTFATFSMPNSGTDHRGYVSYTVKELNDGWMINSWFNYTHQASWLQYPVYTAKENRMSGSWNTAGIFRLVQDGIQFYPIEETEESQY